MSGQDAGAGPQSRAVPDVADLLAADAYAQDLGIRLVSAAPDEVVVEMEVSGDLCDARGRLTDGAVFSLADCAMSLISNAEQTNVAVTVHLTRHGDAAPGDTLRARAVPSAQADATTTWHIEVHGPAGLVGVFTGTTLAV